MTETSRRAPVELGTMATTEVAETILQAPAEVGELPTLNAHEVSKFLPVMVTRLFAVATLGNTDVTTIL
jgi:hypothetical protein